MSLPTNVVEVTVPERRGLHEELEEIRQRWLGQPMRVRDGLIVPEECERIAVEIEAVLRRHFDGEPKVVLIEGPPGSRNLVPFVREGELMVFIGSWMEVRGAFPPGAEVQA